MFCIFSSLYVQQQKVCFACKLQGYISAISKKGRRRCIWYIIKLHQSACIDQCLDPAQDNYFILSSQNSKYDSCPHAVLNTNLNVSELKGGNILLLTIITQKNTNYTEKKEKYAKKINILFIRASVDHGPLVDREGVSTGTQNGKRTRVHILTCVSSSEPHAHAQFK